MHVLYFVDVVHLKVCVNLNQQLLLVSYSTTSTLWYHWRAITLLASKRICTFQAI